MTDLTFHPAEARDEAARRLGSGHPDACRTAVPEAAVARGPAVCRATEPDSATPRRPDDQTRRTTPAFRHARG